MQTRLCVYEDLNPAQRALLRGIEVQPQQIAFCGDIDSALHSLPAHPHIGIKGFVLLGDEQPVAFMILKRQPLLAHWAEPDSATLHAFQVDRRVQGHGLGKICMHELAQAMNELWPEVRQLMLSVSPFNTPALAFYLSQGWVECGEAYRGERRMAITLPPVEQVLHAV